MQTAPESCWAMLSSLDCRSAGVGLSDGGSWEVSSAPGTEMAVGQLWGRRRDCTLSGRTDKTRSLQSSAKFCLFLPEGTGLPPRFLTCLHK